MNCVAGMKYVLRMSFRLVFFLPSALDFFWLSFFLLYLIYSYPHLSISKQHWLVRLHPANYLCPVLLQPIWFDYNKMISYRSPKCSHLTINPHRYNSKIIKVYPGCLGYSPVW